MAVPRDENKQMSIRKIANGYLICESGSDKDGRYYSEETFSATKPTVTVSGNTKAGK